MLTWGQFEVSRWSALEYYYVNYIQFDPKNLIKMDPVLCRSQQRFWEECWGSVVWISVWPWGVFLLKKSSKWPQNVLKTSSKHPQNVLKMFLLKTSFRFFLQTFSSITRHFDISVQLSTTTTTKSLMRPRLHTSRRQNSKKISWLDRDRDSNHGPPALTTFLNFEVKKPRF